MKTVEILEQLQHDARKDDALRKTLLDTQTAADPLREFCSTCRRHGYELYEMEVVNAGEEFYASMRRSTNGGGENSPLLDGEDDFYELFMAGLK